LLETCSQWCWCHFTKYQHVAKTRVSSQDFSKAGDQREIPNPFLCKAVIERLQQCSSTYLCVCSGLPTHDSKINRYIIRGRISLLLSVISSLYSCHPSVFVKIP
jgi:hypothetical protein